MNNKNVNIYVFSGTGNTLLVANKISEVFNNNSCQSKVYRMETVDCRNINLNSTIGIGWPVAFWNTYPLVRNWIDNLPDGNNTEVFLFDTKITL